MKKLLILICILSALPALSEPVFKRPSQFYHPPLEVSIIKDVPLESASYYTSKGDEILDYCEKLKSPKDKERFIVAAKFFYYQASRADVSNQNALIGNARASLLQNNIREAKDSLFMALNFNEHSPRTNFYIGETFYQDGEFLDAIKYYKLAYKYGYGSDYRTNLRLGVCYEKLDAPAQAKTYYSNAMNIMPSLSEPRQRINALYSIKTGYDAYDLYLQQREEAAMQFDPKDLEGVPQY